MTIRNTWKPGKYRENVEDTSEGGIVMVSFPIKFDRVESVEEFVKLVNRLDYDVDLKVEDSVFDAKSIISVMTLATRPGICMEVHAKDAEDI